MNENHKIDFAKKKGLTDEWYTPESAINSIINHLPIGKTIWCPFDTEESNFVKILRQNGFTVEHHIYLKLMKIFLIMNLLNGILLFQIHLIQLEMIF